MVEALPYKLADRGFDSLWCHWNFSLTYFFRSHYGPGVDSASNRNEYQVYLLLVKAAGRKADKFTTNPVELSRNLGTLTSWNTLGPCRPVMVLLYLIVYRAYNVQKNDCKTHSFSCPYKIFEPMFDTVNTVNQFHSTFPLSTLRNLTCDFIRNPILHDRIKFR